MQMILLLVRCSVIHFCCCSLISSSPIYMSKVPAEPWKHTLPHTHTLLHWSFWASPYAASAKAPAVHHPQLPWQQSCTQTACRLAMWPWMQAHPHTHTSHTHTLQHNMYTQLTVTNTSLKITKTHQNTHTQAPDEHEKAHTHVQRTLSKGCLCRGRPYVFTAAHSRYTHSSLFDSAVHWACVKTARKCRERGEKGSSGRERRKDLHSRMWGGKGGEGSGDPNEEERWRWMEGIAGIWVFVWVSVLCI